MNQKLNVIDGPPGSGKSTLLRSLTAEFSDFWLTPIQSITTRARRFPEESEHLFVIPEDFDLFFQTGKLLTVWKRTLEYPDWCWVFLPVRENTIAILGRSGEEDAYKYCKSNWVDFTYIWLHTQADIIEKRLLERWDSKESIKKKITVIGFMEKYINPFRW